MPALSQISLSAATYDAVVSWDERDHRPCCFRDVLATDGMIYLDVRLVLDVPWTDALDRVSFRADDVTIALADGTVQEAIGHFDYFGMFAVQSPGISARRPRDWPNEDEDAYYHAIFQIPAGTTEVTLSVAEAFRTTVTVPGGNSTASGGRLCKFLRPVRRSGA